MREIRQEEDYAWPDDNLPGLPTEKSTGGFSLASLEEGRYGTWCQQLPKIIDNPGQQRARRPGSVRPARVPSAFGQVSSPGHVRESTRAGTCPLGTSDSPTTLRVCASAYGPGIRSTGFPSRMLLPSSL